MSPDYLEDTGGLRQWLDALDFIHLQLGSSGAQVLHLRFLMAITMNPGISQSELARDLDTSSSTLARMVDIFGPANPSQASRPHLRDYVRTVRGGAGDDRICRLFITDRGRTFLKQIIQEN